MVGVQDIRECPQCKSEAHYELQCRDGTETLFCPQCGYNYYSICLTDRKRQKETGKQYYKKTKDGKLIGRTYTQKGYGAFSIDQGTGVISLNRFTCDGTARDKIVAKLKALRRRGLTVNITLVDGDKIQEV